MSTGQVYERGSLRVTDKQNFIDFDENNMLIGLYGYENPEVKAMGVFTFTCADPVVDPSIVIEP